MRRPTTAAATLAAAAAISAGCGALPPQAPLAYARTLDSATSAISSACGEAYRVTAFPGDHRHAIDQLEKAAATGLQKLVKVFKRNPEWVYQGFTVAEIASDGVSMLGSCGLHRAEQQLRAATTSA